MRDYRPPSTGTGGFAHCRNFPNNSSLTVVQADSVDRCLIFPKRSHINADGFGGLLDKPQRWSIPPMSGPTSKQQEGNANDNLLHCLTISQQSQYAIIYTAVNKK